MVKFLLFCLLLTGYGILGARGQGGTVSPYTAFGLGDIANPAFSRGLGMAGVGIATFERTSLNRINPASYADLVITTLEVGGFYRSTLSSTDEVSSRFRSGNLTALALGLKGSKGPVFGFGIAPYSTVGYKVQSFTELPDSTVIQNLSEGAGGLNEFYFGLGHSFLRRRLALGGNVGLIFGNNSIKFRSGPGTDSSPSAIEAFPTTIREDRIRGFNYKLGLTYTDTLSRAKPLLGRIGLTFGGGTTLQLDTRTSYVYRIFVPEISKADTFNNIITPTREGIFVDTTVVLEELPNSQLELPFEIGIGFGLDRIGKYRISGDFVYQGWSEFTRNGEPAGLEDAYRGALGGEWIPRATSSRFFERLIYRAGVRAEKTYLQIEGTDIYQYAASLGVGIPLVRSLSQLNLAVEYGRRGTRSEGLILESYFQISLGMNFTERWFVRRKYD